MFLKSIKLENFRKFKDKTLEFPNENQIVFIGDNGSGKTSVLDAIAKCFAHFIGGLTSNRDDGSYRISDYLNLSDIKNGEIQAKVICEIDYDILPRIEISRRIDETASHYKYSKSELNKLREDILNDRIKQLPILVYYRVNRTSLSTDNKRSNPESFYKPILAGYSHAISPFKSAFIDFDSWFIEKENIENEEIRRRKDFKYQLPELKAIRLVVEKYLSEFYGIKKPVLSVSRKSQDDTFIKEGNIIIEYGDKRVMLSQLSSGEKSVFYILVDIARRLLILNKGNVEFDKHKGVVLIDEIDLHLHPRWQREILQSLSSVFPQIQFICTTHSPQVLSSISKDKIIEIEGDFYPLSSSPMGGESGRILEEIFGTTRRPPRVEELISQIFEKLDSDTFDIGKINKLLHQLKKYVSEDDPIFIRIENYLERRKILSE